MKLFVSMIAIAIVGTMLLSGCGKSDTQNKLEQMQDSLTKMNEKNSGGSNVVNNGSGGGEHKPVPAIDYHRLLTFLPQIGGYTQEKPQGATMQMSEWNYSSANAEYSAGEAHITVNIFDYAYIETLMAAYKMKFSFENEDGYTKSTDLAGFAGWETWQKNDKSASCIAIVGDRFVVVVEGHGQNDANQVRGVLAGMDLKGIAALK